jgi:hypothetical protein
MTRKDTEQQSKRLHHADGVRQQADGHLYLCIAYTCRTHVITFKRIPRYDRPSRYIAETLHPLSIFTIPLANFVTFSPPFPFASPWPQSRTMVAATQAPPSIPATRGYCNNMHTSCKYHSLLVGSCNSLKLAKGGRKERKGKERKGKKRKEKKKKRKKRITEMERERARESQGALRRRNSGWLLVSRLGLGFGLA